MPGKSDAGDLSIATCLETILSRLHDHPAIAAVWLFGSVAQGRARSGSDIDLAVLFVPGLSPVERFDLRLTLMRELEDIARRPVDVVDMESAPLFLQHQVRKTGRLILEKDRQRRIDFDVRSRRDYFDLKPLLERRRAAMLGRCLKEGDEK